MAKYRRVIFDEEVEEVLREVCRDIALRLEIEFLEIGLDGDHVHFLVPRVPTYSPTKIVTRLKSLIAREIFARCPQVKKKLWGGECWSDGYFIASVGQHERRDGASLCQTARPRPQLPPTPCAKGCGPTRLVEPRK